MQTDDCDVKVDTPVGPYTKTNYSVDPTKQDLSTQDEILVERSLKMVVDQQLPLPMHGRSNQTTYHAIHMANNSKEKYLK